MSEPQYVKYDDGRQDVIINVPTTHVRMRVNGLASMLPPEFWGMNHNCPLCNNTMDAETFLAHAPECIKRNAPRGKVWVPGVTLIGS